MEKSRKTRRFSQSNRLLICAVLLFLFNTISLFAHRYSYAVFKPVEEYVFADEDTAFETIIYNMRPADVLVTVQTLPENVTFVSSEKTEILDENGRSTRIRIVLHFNDVGKFNLPPVASRIRYGSYKLSIAPVNVLYNPQTIQPIVKFSVLEPTDKLYFEGQHIKIKLSAFFASNIYSFSTSLNEDSVFYPENELVSLPLEIEKFSDTEYPIGIFEFIPLASGKIEVPEVSVRVKAWNGMEKIAISEPLVLNVKKSVKVEVALPEENKQVQIEQDAKVSENISKTSKKEESKKYEDKVHKIKELRLSEKNKILPLSLIKERKQLESECGLQNSQNELSEGIFYIILGVFAIFVILFVIFAIFRKKIYMVIFVVLSLIMLLIVGVYKFQLNKDYALVLYGEVLSIPEESSSINVTLNSGFRVEIKGETKDWIFIEYSNSTGWIKRENLLFLK